MSLAEIVALLEDGDNDEELEAVFIKSPDCNVDSDEDSDDDGEGRLDDLSGRALQVVLQPFTIK